MGVTNDNEAAIFRRSLELLEQALTSVIRLTPNENRTLPVLEFTPLRIFWQSVTRCQAIHLLLQEGFIGEAAIILRSLMFDAHYLMYLNRNPAKRDALILSLRAQEIRSWEELAAIAKEAGIERDVEPIMARVKEEDQKVQRKMKALGIAKLQKFPAQGASMARSLRRLTDMVGHKMYSLIVHSAAQGPVSIGVEKNEDGEVRFHLRDKNANLVRGVSHSAAEYLFEATIAIATWQNWSGLEGLKEQYRDIDASFTSLEGYGDA